MIMQPMIVIIPVTYKDYIIESINSIFIKRGLTPLGRARKCPLAEVTLVQQPNMYIHIYIYIYMHIYIYIYVLM